MSKSDVPLELYIAAYMDPDGAQQDWDGIKQMVADKVIDVEAMALVSRDENGKIHVKDDAHHARHGAKKGAIGGALVGLIFPPTIIAGAVVGAAAGGVAGGVLTRVERRKIKADVEATLPVGSSAIVALFEERWLGDLEKALAKADRFQLEHLHDDDHEVVDEADETPAPATAAASSPSSAA
ncbi:MAG TPA: DUF1269 domain-containing protein [Amnibacterium sp.]|uniref:DUF1269 domain-containing protein n=1 Tax=Amnibacterium sp. TaxID=1872496 RepID=UPI002F943EBA